MTRYHTLTEATNFGCVGGVGGYIDRGRNGCPTCLGRHPCQEGNLTRRGIDTIAGSMKKVDAVSFNDKDSILEVFGFAG